jgi:hypothetical protein
VLEGSLSVHLDGEGERLPVFRDAIASGELPNGHAADDGAALVFHGTEFVECVASRPGARVVRVTADGAGGVREAEQPVRLLAGGERPVSEQEEGYDVSEMRSLRTGRHRWE